jgi:hypothetical protein
VQLPRTALHPCIIEDGKRCFEPLARVRKVNVDALNPGTRFREHGFA